MTEEQSLEEFFAQEPEPVDEQLQVSRRRFLAGSVAGGAAGLAVAAGTGIAVWKITDAELLAAKEAAESELLATRESAKADLNAAQEIAAAESARLMGLIHLYENLEKVGLDAILHTGMAAVTIPLEGVELGAKALKGGLDLVENALLALDDALPSAEESILWIEARVSALADGVGKLETALGKALDKATDNRIADALRDFASMILDNLPFGLGDKIRDVLDGLVGLVTSVDDLIEGTNTHLLEPLREKWFSTEEGQGVGGTLVEPMVEHILDPLEAHLEKLAILIDTWQDKLMAPTERALEERSKIRQDIAAYREAHGIE